MPRIALGHDLQVCEKSDPAGPVAGQATFTIFSVDANAYIQNPVNIPVGSCTLIYENVGVGRFIITQTLTRFYTVHSITAVNSSTGLPITEPILTHNRKAGRATIEISDGVTAIVTFTNVSAPDEFRFFPLEVPGLSDTVATAINNEGAITGYGTGPNGQTGFVEHRGRFTTVFVPGSTGTVVSGINNAGMIVGTYTNLTGSHGFEYHEGTFTTIDAPPPALPNTTRLVGINDSDQIIGNSKATGKLPPITSGAFIEHSGSFQFFINETLSGINNLGTLVGHAFFFVLIPDAPAYGPADSLNALIAQFPVMTNFNALNDRGQIVVESEGTNYIIPGAANKTLAAPIIFPGSSATDVLGINDHQQFVGAYRDSSNVSHAFWGYLPR
ncbi:MAG TPA: hypothetical protein VN519_15730 [Bryobacteraceae bacterium]|nr:hypothetical protein [Bryobacteraceae bacterium]